VIVAPVAGDIDDLAPSVEAAVLPAIERITVSTSLAKREAVGASRTAIQSIARIC
jgi:hypothetical protein